MIKKKRKHANIVGESDGDGDGDGDNDNIIQPSTYTISKPSSVSVLPANDSTNITNPKYGSKEYWEKRYSNALNDNHTKAAYEGYCQTTNDNDDGSVDNINKKSDDDDDDDASAGHEWYFTYQELKSLILPLILDCRGDEFDDWEDNEDDNTENDQEVDDDDGWEEVENDNENSSEENEEEEEGNNEEEDSIHDDGDNNNNNNKKDINNNSDGDGDGDDSDDDEFLEIFKSKIEQSILPPPKKLLEIGCGDVPILRDLCNDMLDLQSKTTGNIKSIIEQIICFDYSEIAIEFLIKDEKGKCDNTKEGHHEQELKVDYKVMDARTLNYQDKEFDLILDKGTLDAMLSDEIEGKENCLKIISEASRVLSLRGYLMIVSHLNACNSEGLLWANEILVTGLRSGDKESDWRVEVHSSDADDDNEMLSTTNEEKEDDYQERNNGPAVYIIQKQSVSSEEQMRRKKNNVESNVSMKVFGY